MPPCSHRRCAAERRDRSNAGSPHGCREYCFARFGRRTRGSIAGNRYESDGIKRLDVLGNLTNKFMRTYTLQVEALARKRRKGEQNIRVKHVHVYDGGQAIVGNVSHRGGRGYRKIERQGYEPEREKPATPAISDSPSVRSANQERQALPVASDEKGALSATRRRKG